LLFNESGDLASCMTAWFLVGGAAAAALALLVEVFQVLGAVAGRRSAFGFNATVQVALAIVLLAGLNVYSYYHYRRSDWTLQHQFTLPAEIQRQLQQLK